MSKWYILFVLGGNEEKIRDFLIDEGFDAFLPKMEVIHRKNGFPYKAIKLMFPNYIFIESELDHVEFHERVRALRMKKSGIIKELKFDNEGTDALSDSERKLIERLVGKNKVMEHSVGFIEGDKIIVTDGPLLGLESHIKRVDRHKRRAFLEVEMLGQITTVNVSLEIIKKC